MPAPTPPDQTPLVRRANGRTVAVHLTPSMVDPAAFAGGIVVMIDALRASATIAAALHAGAARVIPTLTVEEARAVAAGLEPGSFLLGGERGGVRIPGFDLANSPTEYAPAVVSGKTIVFTTTNGTAALLHARGADVVLVGSFPNVSAIIDALAADQRPVHLLCAGTRGEVTLDDALAAGAMVDRLINVANAHIGNDSALLALNAWHRASGDLGAAVRRSLGGRNLSALNLDSDIGACLQWDCSPIVPRFRVAEGEIRCS